MSPAAGGKARRVGAWSITRYGARVAALSEPQQHELATVLVDLIKGPGLYKQVLGVDLLQQEFLASLGGMVTEPLRLIMSVVHLQEEHFRRTPMDDHAPDRRSALAINAKAMINQMIETYFCRAKPLAAWCTTALLSPDLSIIFLRFCDDARTISRVAQVCKAWASGVVLQPLWRAVVTKRWPGLGQQLPELGCWRRTYRLLSQRSQASDHLQYVRQQERILERLNTEYGFTCVLTDRDDGAVLFRTKCYLELDGDRLSDMCVSICAEAFDRATQMPMPSKFYLAMPDFDPDNDGMPSWSACGTVSAMLLVSRVSDELVTQLANFEIELSEFTGERRFVSVDDDTTLFHAAGNPAARILLPSLWNRTDFVHNIIPGSHVSFEVDRSGRPHPHDMLPWNVREVNHPADTTFFRINVEFTGTPVPQVDAPADTSSAGPSAGASAGASAAIPAGRRWQLDRLELRLHWGREVDRARNAPKITTADLGGHKGVPPSELFHLLTVCEWL
jgi:hypothetical protein